MCLMIFQLQQNNIYEKPLIISESVLQECIENIYTFVFLLTGNTHSAEEITVKVVTREYFYPSGKLNISHCLKSAYRKCEKSEYTSDDDYLMKRLALLTFSERGLVLLKYRLSYYYLMLTAINVTSSCQDSPMNQSCGLVSRYLLCKITSIAFFLRQSSLINGMKCAAFIPQI